MLSAQGFRFCVCLLKLKLIFVAFVRLCGVLCGLKCRCNRLKCNCMQWRCGQPASRRCWSFRCVCHSQTLASTPSPSSTSAPTGCVVCGSLFPPAVPVIQCRLRPSALPGILLFALRYFETWLKYSDDDATFLYSVFVALLNLGGVVGAIAADWRYGSYWVQISESLSWMGMGGEGEGGDRHMG